jgi:ribonuclease P protein component
MLKSANRLKKKKDFERVSKQGKTISQAFLVLKFFKNNQELSRVGIVVSKKVSNKAVVRNKIKRQLRAIMKDLIGQIKPGYDLVFFTRPSASQKDFESIAQVVNNLVKKANLI